MKNNVGEQYMLNFYKKAVRIVSIIISVLWLFAGFYFAYEGENIKIFIGTAISISIFLLFTMAFSELLGAVAELRGETKTEYEKMTIKDYLSIFVIVVAAIIGCIILWLFIK